MSTLATTIDTATASGWGVALAAFLMAAFERFKSAKLQTKTAAEDETLSLAKASEARGNMMGKIADDYKLLLEQERIEHKKTRDYWHEENGKSQALISAANLKVLELQDRPDLRDILEALKLQGEVIQKQGEGIREILLHLTKQ